MPWWCQNMLLNFCLFVHYYHLTTTTNDATHLSPPTFTVSMAQMTLKCVIWAHGMFLFYFILLFINPATSAPHQQCCSPVSASHWDIFFHCFWCFLFLAQFRLARGTQHLCLTSPTSPTLPPSFRGPEWCIKTHCLGPRYLFLNCLFYLIF